MRKFWGNQRGFVVEGILVICLLVSTVVLLTPNLVSHTLGTAPKPSKTVQTDATTQTLMQATTTGTPDGEPLYHKDGSVALVSQTLYKKQDLDIQPKASFWDSLLALPRLWLLLMVLGLFFPPVAGFMGWFNSKAKAAFSDLQEDTKKIVKSVDMALHKIPDQVSIDGKTVDIKQMILDELSKMQDASTKNLVADLKRQ